MSQFFFFFSAFLLCKRDVKLCMRVCLCALHEQVEADVQEAVRAAVHLQTPRGPQTQLGGAAYMR